MRWRTKLVVRVYCLILEIISRRAASGSPHDSLPVSS